MIKFVGDCHGKFSQFENIINQTPLTTQIIQVGDMGIGFGPNDPMFDENVWFIRGNHDNPEKCEEHPNWVRDGFFDCGTLYIGGAWSIDREFRTEGVDWWRDEELSYEDFQHIIEIAEDRQPKVIVSHDCPQSIVPLMFGREAVKTRTQQALDAVLAVCFPKLWVFGHFHQTVDKVINGTRFICLDELATVEIDVKQL